MRAARLIALLALTLSARAAPPAAHDALVLVSVAASPINTLDSLAVRKAFVGLPVSAGGHPVRAVLNDADPDLRPLFLQHVVGFTESAYQRRVLTLTLQQGRAAPASYTDSAALLRALRSDPTTVTYMWQSAAARLPDLRVIKVVWQE